MDTDDQRRDAETAAAWLLRRLGWGEPALEAAPPPGQQAGGASSCALQNGSLAGDDVDIACWPALVAPFYD
jgi:hypothetical protein